RSHGSSVHILGGGNSSYVQDCRRDVDILYHLTYLSIRFDVFTHHKQRHPPRFFIRMTLVDQAMFTEGESVVADIKYNSIFHKPVLVQVLQDALYTFIDAKQCFAVPLIERVKRNSAVIHIVHTVPAIPLLLHPVGQVCIIVGSCIVAASAVAWR